MESINLLLKEEEDIRGDIDSINNAANSQSMTPRPRPLFLKVSHPPIWIHLILLASYTVFYMWIVKAHRNDSGVRNEMIYCIASLNSRPFKPIALTILVSQLQLERLYSMRGKSFFLPSMETHTRGPPDQNSMLRGIIC